MVEKKGYHHGDLRERILEVAREEILRQGVSGLSLRSVARRAGVSEAAPYHHFAGRDGLLCEIAREGFEGLAKALERGWDSGGDPPSRLKAVAIAYATFCAEHPAQFRAMFGEHMDQIAVDLRPRKEGGAARDVLQRVAAETVQTHGLARSREAVERLLWSAMHGVATLLIEREFQGGESPQAVIEDMASLLVAGFGSSDRT